MQVKLKRQSKLNDHFHRWITEYVFHTVTKACKTKTLEGQVLIQIVEEMDIFFAFSERYTCLECCATVF